MNIIKDFFFRLFLMVSLLIVSVVAAVEFVFEYIVLFFAFLFFNKEFDLLLLARKLDEKLDEIKWQ